jgi:hypothetical protein
MAALGPRRRQEGSFWASLAPLLFEGKVGAAFVVVTSLASLAVVFPGLVEYFGTGHVTLHWSRVILGSFGLLLAFQAVVTGVLMQVLEIWALQRTDREQRQNEQQPAFAHQTEVVSSSVGD